MLERSQATGRIAILAAFTLLFAAAWRSDAPAAPRPAATLAATRRAGYANHIDCAGSIALGAAGEQNISRAITGTNRVVGALACNAIHGAAHSISVATPFSGKPALLGRSTLPIAAADAPDEAPNATAAIDGESALQ